MRIATMGAAAALAVFGALVAPMPVATADESAQETITRLRDQGYNVIVDRVGSGRLDDCVATGVRNPQTISRMPLGDENDGLNLTSTIVLRQTITVSLNCSG